MHVEFKERLLTGLGGPFPESGPLNPKILKTEQREGYELRWITYESEPNDAVPAILLVPDGVNADNPAPAVCVWPQHNGQWHLGKTEQARPPGGT